MSNEILENYREIYTKLAPKDKDLTVLETCYTKQQSLTPLLIYLTTNIPDKLSNDVLEVCARRAVYEAYTISRKTSGDNITLRILNEQEVAFMQEFWEIPPHIIKKYRQTR